LKAVNININIKNENENENENGNDISSSESRIIIFCDELLAPLPIEAKCNM
jgi:hypothetical protein